VKKRVLIAVSGGVDSSVACHLLKKKGYQVIAATIKTWPKKECGAYGSKLCCSLDAISSARSICGKLGVPHYVFDFSKEFRNKIILLCERDYKKGRTPNPCVLCNSEIKFGLLLKKADELACDYLSSGHYANVVCKEHKYYLKKGKDRDKDQSYFLFNLSQHQLSRILFPLGRMKKDEVRALAKKVGLKSHDRASSQDLCFGRDGGEELVGDIMFRGVKRMGKHKGISHYTVGQRKGLGVAFSEPLYVTHIDALNNALHVGTIKDSYKEAFIADCLHWINGSFSQRRIHAKAKIRYGSKEVNACIQPLSRNTARVTFEKPQFSPTPGQAVVFYKKDTVLGGGWIKDVL